MIGSLVAVMLSTVSSTTTTGCAPTAIVRGAPEVIDAVKNHLENRGVATRAPDPAAPKCPWVTADVVAHGDLDEGARLSVDISDGQGRRSQRDVSDAVTVATLIASWAQADLVDPLLDRPGFADETPPIDARPSAGSLADALSKTATVTTTTTAESAAPTHTSSTAVASTTSTTTPVGPAAPTPVSARPEPPTQYTLHISTRTDTGFTPDHVVVGLSSSGCVFVESFCIGAAGRIAGSVDGGSAINAAVLFHAEYPIALRTGGVDWTLTPAAGLGIGLHDVSVRRSSLVCDDPINRTGCRFGPPTRQDSLRLGMLAELRLSGTIPFSETIAGEVSVATALSPRLSDGPAVITFLGFGLRWELQ